MISIGNLALSYEDLGQWKDAEELQKQVVETERRVLGKQHTDTLTGMINLAAIHGQYEKAEELEIQVVETSKSMLGPEHPRTLTIVGENGIKDNMTLVKKTPIHQD